MAHTLTGDAVWDIKLVCIPGPAKERFCASTDGRIFRGAVCRGAHHGENMKSPSLLKNRRTNLTEGSIPRQMLLFAFPLFLGQLLQQFYNMADAWVVGNFATNEAFAAVSSAGNVIFLIIGFFNGISVGGGVIISRYFGARDRENTRRAVHTNVVMGVFASLLATFTGLALVRHVVVWMNVPADVMPDALTYYGVYFGGVSTVIMYNIGMSVMRALGDSLHPLGYLLISSILNVALDLLLVAGLKMGVAGAAWATVVSQGVSAALCFLHLARAGDDSRLSWREMRLYPDIMKQVLFQGIPTGVQGAVISVGNLVLQSHINSFGAYAMSGHGAYSKIEGFAFLPVNSMSMSLPTFVSQNLGAGEYRRARRGAVFGIVFGMVFAEAVGLAFYFGAEPLLRFFAPDMRSVGYGMAYARVTTLFYCLLSFSHCAAGVLRGCGKSVVPMLTMLFFWCGVRILFAAFALSRWREFTAIAWAYPITWSLSTLVFLVFLLCTDWTRGFEKA